MSIIRWSCKTFLQKALCDMYLTLWKHLCLILTMMFSLNWTKYFCCLNIAYKFWYLNTPWLKIKISPTMHTLTTLCWLTGFILSLAFWQKDLCQNFLYVHVMLLLLLLLLSFNYKIYYTYNIYWLALFEICHFSPSNWMRIVKVRPVNHLLSVQPTWDNFSSRCSLSSLTRPQWGEWKLGWQDWGCQDLPIVIFLCLW